MNTSVHKKWKLLVLLSFVTCCKGYSQHLVFCVNNTEPYSYYWPFVFSAWCGWTDQINMCDKHCERASPGGSATDCVCVFSRWSLNGTLIDLGNDYRRHMSGGSLIISNLDKDQDTGVYQCMAFNTWGSILSRRASLQFACEWSCTCQCVYWHDSSRQLWLSICFLLYSRCYVAMSFRPKPFFHPFTVTISHSDCLQIDFWEWRW